jgi:hypothetical protein
MYKRRLRAWILPVYGVLLAFSIPWYWPAGDVRHVFGVPLWALAVLVAVFAISVFTAWVYLANQDDGPT